MAETPATSNNPEFIEQFLSNVRGTVPLSIEQIGVMLGLIAATGQPVQTCLDLGCGGGVVLPAVLDEYPEAEALVIEASGRQLEAARQQVGSRASKVSFQIASVHTPQWTRVATTALAPYDLILSGVEIPLLPAERQRTFFEEACGLLRPGGLLLAVQYVASATRWTQSPWDDQMIEAMFGPELAKDRSRPRAEVAWEYYQQGQKVAPLEVQCEWLRELGLESVECFLKVSELAVFGGQRPVGERGFVTG